MPDFVPASELSTRSVVYIKTAAREQYQRFSWFDIFFNGGGMNERQVLGSGSGVIFSTDGYIVTNYHVIEGADQIEVIHQRRSYQAQVVGTAPSADLALLRIEGKNFPAIRLARSKEVKVGEWVLAVGNPFNLESTVTAGIVSAKGRNIHILKDQFPIESFIQTDAAINPGNSGGALVNLRGELVGINTAILSKTGSYAGYGFAIPSDIVAKIVRDLKEYGEVQKAFIGAEVTDVPLPEDAANTGQGVTVVSVEDGGAADKAGLEKGDVITRINDAVIGGKGDFDEQLSYYMPGEKVDLVFQRANRTLTRQIQFTSVEGTTSTVKSRKYVSEKLGGAELERVSKVERNRLGIEGGVRVRKPGRGLIAQMNLPAGFVISEVNNTGVSEPEELEKALNGLRGRLILKGYNNQGQGQFFSFYMN